MINILIIYITLLQLFNFQTPQIIDEINSIQKAYVTYNEYSKNYPLSSCSCSDGPNGLITRFGYTNISPMFPYVAAYDKSEWNSINCGVCFGIHYQQKTVYVTAIDACGSSSVGSHFDMSEEAFVELFGEKGKSQGSYITSFQVVDPCNCKGNKGCNSIQKKTQDFLA